MNEKKIEKAHELMELIKSKVSTNTSTDDVEAIVKEFLIRKMIYLKGRLVWIQKM